MKNKYFCKLLATLILTFASLHAFGLTTTAKGGDTGNTDVPFWAADSEYVEEFKSQCIDAAVPKCTSDDSTLQQYYLPIYLVLPDNDPISIARAFSFDSASSASSTKPTVTCPGATIDSSGTYSVTITLTDGASCALTIVSPTSSTTYTTTLSRAGNVYSVSAGTVCGGVFTCGGADTTEPDTTIDSKTPNTTPTNSTSMNFTFSGTDDVAVSSYECQLDNGGYAACTTPKNYINLAPGSHTFDVRAKDAAGNTDASPASYTWSNVQSLVINEIDYDQPTSPADSAEFIEIKNVSGSAINLSGYTVEFINDINDSVYRTVTLPSTSLAANDYYVICSNNATVANCDLDSTPDTNFIQNGAPDIARIVQGSFIVDTVSYGGTAAPAIYVEGTGTVADSTTQHFVGLSRYPDGTDTNNNNSDFALKCMTPGVANSVDANSGCYALSINDPTAVTEGNSGTTTLTFTVTLSHATASNVTVNYATANDTATAGSDYTSASGTLTFAAGETSKTISITVSGDQIDESNETFKVNLTSPSSNAKLSATAGATEGVGTITDDDTAGFTLNKTTGSVNESGATDTFTVVLDSQPTSNVEISISSADTGEATVSPATLTFTTANWNTAQTVTVTGVDDGSVSDGNKNTTVTLSIVDANSDNAYDSLADKTVTVTTVDNDTPGISGAQIGGSINATEGGANGSYTLALSSQPTGNIEITVTANAQTQVSKDSTTFGNTAVFTFTTTNWNTAQTVTVKAIDDTTVEGSHTATITHAITGTVNDGNYPTSLTLGNVTVNIADNDRAPSNNGGSTSSGSVVLPSKMQMSVNISGIGSGRVISQPNGIDCQKNSGTCQASFPTNSQVTLVATADENSELSGFGGHTDCGDGSLLLFGNRQCTVFFTKKQATSPPDNSSGDHHNMISVYRLWSHTWKGHFYTTNAIEKDRTLSYQQDWRDEDVAYYVYDTADHPDNTHPVYRLWSHVWQSHLYTMNELEMKRLVTHFSDQWRYEGVAYYAYTEGEQPTNAIPVYRFYSFVYQSHFYTINENEKNVLLTHPDSEWRYEEVAWYVPIY